MLRNETIPLSHVSKYMKTQHLGSKKTAINESPKNKTKDQQLHGRALQMQYSDSTNESPVNGASKDTVAKAAMTHKNRVN